MLCDTNRRKPIPPSRPHASLHVAMPAAWSNRAPHSRPSCDTTPHRYPPTLTPDRQVLGQGAVHGAFSGYTGFTTGLVNTHYVYLPIETIIQAPRKVNPTGR